MDVAILLDGDFTRRVLRRKLGHWPSVRDLEHFCNSIPLKDETIVGQVLYYLTDIATIRRTKGVLVRSFTSHRLI